MPTGNPDSYFEWDKVTNGITTKSNTYATTDFTDSAIRWINEQDGQWFTWLAYTAPPYPIAFYRQLSYILKTGLSGSETDIRRNSETYFIAMLEAVDTEIGRLIGSLDQTVRENTYIILIGDNGTGGNCLLKSRISLLELKEAYTPAVSTFQCWSTTHTKKPGARLLI